MTTNPHWYHQICVSPELSLLEGIKRINVAGHQILIIVDEEKKLKGVVTDGDIRRAIASGQKLETLLKEIMTTNPICLKEPISTDRALKVIKKKMVKYIPVVNESGRVEDVLCWQDFLVEKPWLKECRPEPVIIMAGGKGTRLDPFTRILPKPLIPFGDKPIIVWIMDNFASKGFKNFWVTLNYKKDAIKNFFAVNSFNYRVGFIEEERFLGTAGSLQLFEDVIDSTFIVCNCDVVLREDYAQLLEFHKENQFKATVLAACKELQVPYGVLEIDEADCLTAIREKPRLSYTVSAGIYVLDKSILGLIEENEYIEMPELLLRIKDSFGKGAVGVYETKNEWFDIGKWGDYQAATEFFKKVILL